MADVVGEIVAAGQGVGVLGPHDPLTRRHQRGELIPRSVRITRPPRPVGKLTPGGQRVGVLGPQNSLTRRHQRGELIPRSRRITGLPRPVGKLTPGGQRVGVLGAQNSLTRRHQRGELIPRGRRITCLPQPQGQAYLGSQVVIRLLRVEVRIAYTPKCEGLVRFDVPAPIDGLGNIFPIVRFYFYIFLRGYRVIKRRHHPGGQGRVDLFYESAQVSLGDSVLLHQVRQASRPPLGQRGTHFLPLRPSSPGKLVPGFIEAPLGQLGLFGIPLAQQLAESAPGRIPRISVGGSHHCPSSLRRQRE